MAAEWQGQCHVHGRLTYMKTCAESKVVDLFKDFTTRERRRSCTRNYSFEINFHNRTLAFASGPKLTHSLLAARGSWLAPRYSPARRKRELEGQPGSLIQT